MLRFSSKLLTHNFFASYHGHSLADGHAAVVKRCLQTRYLISELERATHLPNATWGPANVHQVSQVIRDKCSDTEVVVFEDIDRDEERKPHVRAVPASNPSISSCTRMDNAGPQSEQATLDSSLSRLIDNCTITFHKQHHTTGK